MPGGKSLYRNCSLFKLYRTNAALTQTLSAHLDPISFCLCETQTEAVSPCIPLRSLIDFFLSFSFHHVKIKHIILRAEGNEAEVNIGGVHSLSSHAQPVEKLSLSVIPGNVLVSLWRKAAFLGSFSAWRCEAGKQAEKQVPD